MGGSEKGEEVRGGGEEKWHGIKILEDTMRRGEGGRGEGANGWIVRKWE